MGVDLGAVREEELHGARVTRAARDVQRAAAGGLATVGIFSGRDERCERGLVAVAGGEEERGDGHETRSSHHEGSLDAQRHDYILSAWPDGCTVQL